MKKETQIGNEAVEKLKDIVDKVEIAMMCTLTENNQIESRPMRTAGFEPDGTLWFFSNRYSAKTQEMKNESNICLCYSNPSNNTYASVHGTTVVITDRAKMEELWDPLLMAWLPNGKDDPQLALIRVQPHHAEYWDDKSNKWVTLFKVAASAFTGSDYEAGDFGKLKFRSSTTQ